MAKPMQWLIVSLPTSVAPSNDPEEAFGALRACTATEDGSIAPFTVPEFKIGTLDALVQQAEELGKLESSCEAVANKVGDTLRIILDGDEEKISQQKTVNDSECVLRCAGWLLTLQNPLLTTSTPSAGTATSTGRTGQSGS